MSLGELPNRLATDCEDESADFQLAPPETSLLEATSNAEQRELLQAAGQTEQEAVDETGLGQFSLAQVFFLVTVGSLGFAGTIYLPPSLFAAAVGGFALLFAMGISIYLPESRAARLVFQALCAIYLFAVLGTAMRMLTGEP